MVKQIFAAIFILVGCCIHYSQGISPLLAGVSKVDGTLPVGTPLAGYDYAPRSVETWPIPILREYTSFMNPSTGIINPTWIKALVLDNGDEEICMVTIDAIGADGWLQEIAWLYAKSLGFTIPLEKCTFHASHTHSGPGAISASMLFSIVPATDLLCPSLQESMAKSIGTAMYQAQKNKVPAKFGINSGALLGVTHNRRDSVNGKKNPYLNYSTIDPFLGVVRIDKADGTPLATVWNFAIHGICFDAPNMMFSSDVMGSACEALENATNGAVALFINGDAGDTNPVFDVACKNPPTPSNPYSWSGGPIIAKAVMNIRNNVTTSDMVTINHVSKQIPFGPTNLNLTLSRIADCYSGGPGGICSICAFLRCDLNLHLPESWIEDTPRFSAIEFSVQGRNTLMVTVPGEALIELGWMIKNMTQSLGFSETFILGYTNDYLGYFSTPDQYDLGGYESLMTLWGINSSYVVSDSVEQVVKELLQKRE